MQTRERTDVCRRHSAEVGKKQKKTKKNKTRRESARKSAHGGHRYLPSGAVRRVALSQNTLPKTRSAPSNDDSLQVGDERGTSRDARERSTSVAGYERGSPRAYRACVRAFAQAKHASERRPSVADTCEIKLVARTTAQLPLPTGWLRSCAPETAESAPETDERARKRAKPHDRGSFVTDGDGRARAREGEGEGERDLQPRTRLPWRSGLILPRALARTVPSSRKRSSRCLCTHARTHMCVRTYVARFSLRRETSSIEKTNGKQRAFVLPFKPSFLRHGIFHLFLERFEYNIVIFFVKLLKNVYRAEKYI